MIIYYFTFGHNHNHPITNENMRDYWIEIIAESYEDARDLMHRLFHVKWSHQYESEHFSKHYFPKGCYERFSIIKNY